MTAHASNESFLQDLTEMSGKIWLHHAVATAVNLGIFDLLADNPTGCDTLASKLKADAPTL